MCGFVVSDEGYRGTSFKECSPCMHIDQKVSNYYSRNPKRTLVAVYWALKNHPNQSRKLTMRVFRNTVKVIKLEIASMVLFVVAILAGLGVVKKYADAPPSGTIAPYVVQTSSGLYLVRN